MPNPTRQQQTAIDAELREPVIVTAAAGSGKTTLLVDRIIRLLSDKSLDIPADTLAVMSFTRNAAENLRSKLTLRLLAEKARLMRENTPESLEKAKYLSEQTIALRQSFISTIDAFCISIIRENAHTFELPINFRIADAAKKASMQATAMRDTMNYLYENDGDAPESEISAGERAALFYTFNYENDTALQNAVMDISEKLSSYADADDWLEKSALAYSGISALEGRYIDVYNRRITGIITNAYHYLRQYKDIIKPYDEDFVNRLDNPGLKNSERKKLTETREAVIPNLYDVYRSDRACFRTVAEHAAKFRKHPSLCTLCEFLEFVNTFDWKSAAAALTQKGRGDSFKKAFSSMRKRFLELKEELLKLPYLSMEEEEQSLSTGRMAVGALVKLVKKYSGRYREIKLSSGCPDFSDCEIMLLERLRSDTAFREQLAARFSCVIVDEFQDSNDVQAEIFRLISNGGNLFYVGDVKQAIYTFRGGNPEIMANMCRVPQKPKRLSVLCPAKNCFDKNKGIVPAAANSGLERFKLSARLDAAEVNEFYYRHRPFSVIPLNRNFRSRKTIIEFVNAVFSGIMTRRYGGVDYSDGQGLRYGSIYPAEPPENARDYETEVYLLSTPKERKDDENESSDMPQARFAAKRIKELYESGFTITENGTKRRSSYKDYAILVRTNGEMKAYGDALSELGIPSVVPASKDFLESEEITLVMNLLKVIDNPLKDEEMLKVLMSPLYDFTAEETAEIRLGTLGLPDISDEDARALAKKLKGSSLYGCLTLCTRELSLNNAEESGSLADDEINAKRTTHPKARRFMRDLLGFRFFMSSNSIEKLIDKIYDDTEIYSVINTFENSAQKIANIRLLKQYAVDFEENEGGTLSDFIRYITNTRAFRTQLEAASAPTDAENAVKIMTFHASKGLEMPVVIVPGLNRRLMTDSGAYLMNHEYGLSLYYVDRKARYRYEPFAYNAIKDVNKNSTYGEELRLLYVVMTRAREKLILMGSTTKSPGEMTMIDGIPETALTGTVPLYWIMASLLRCCDKNEILGFEKDGAMKIGRLNAYIYRRDTPEKPAPIDTKSVLPEADDNITAKILKNLSAVYPYKNETAMQEKFAVTELAHSDENDDEIVYITKPSFMSRSEYSGKEIGDAYHHLMRYFPLEKMRAAKSTDERMTVTGNAIDLLAANGKITERERDILTAQRQKSAEKITRFFESDLGVRMLRSKKVERELPFYAELPAKSLGLDYDGNIGIQGQIDMFFYEDDGIVLVDYKSDSEKSMEKERESYRRQISIYKSILPKITGTQVKQMFLYSFSASAAIDAKTFSKGEK